MSKKLKMVCGTKITLDTFVILLLRLLDSAVTRCISVSTFASLVGIPVGITSSVVGLIIYAITAIIKKFYYSII